MNKDDPLEAFCRLVDPIGPAAQHLIRFWWHEALRKITHDCQHLICFAEQYTYLQVDAALDRMLRNGCSDIAMLAVLLDDDPCCLDALPDEPQPDRSPAP